MRFVSYIGRPWTLGEMETAFKLRLSGYEVGTIATLLDRSVNEIKAVLG